jgi:hypothetical protein
MALAGGALAIIGSGRLLDSDAVSEGIALISLLAFVGVLRRRGRDHPEESLHPDAKFPSATWVKVALVLAATAGVVWGVENWLDAKAGAAALFVGVVTAIDLSLRQSGASASLTPVDVGSSESPRSAGRIWARNRFLRWLSLGLLLWGIFLGIAYLISLLAAPSQGSLLLGLAGIVLIGGCSFGLARLHADGQRRASGRAGGLER